MYLNGAHSISDIKLPWSHLLKNSLIDNFIFCAVKIIFLCSESESTLAAHRLTNAPGRHLSYLQADNRAWYIPLFAK